MKIIIKIFILLITIGQSFCANAQYNFSEKTNNLAKVTDIRSYINDNTRILTDANIIGHIKDAKTGEHIPFATIMIKGTTIGASCDGTGHYFLKNLPLGSFTIIVKMMGYSSIEKEVNLKPNKTLELNFNLKEDNVALDQVVISASRTETKRRNSPSLVNVIGDKILKLTSSATLADGLVFQPGVRVEDNCQNCGFTQVRINGLDGHYSQILMDSRPVFSALTGVYGLEQIPSNMIQRIEVVRGGGSALFGSSAIGGTVNIITKEPIRNSGSLSNTITTIGMSGAIDNNTTANASVISDNNKMGITIYGQRRNRKEYDDNDDGFSEIPRIESNTLGLSTFMRLTDFSKLKLQYHSIKEFRRGGDQIDLPAHEVMIAEQIDHNINGGNLSYDLFSKDENSQLNIFTSFQNTKRKSYYGGNKDLNAYGRTNDLVIVSGAQFTHKFNYLFFMPSEFVLGLEHKFNDLEDICTGYNHYVEQFVRIYSGYIQNEWKDEKWGFLIGARFDKHNLLDDVVFSPRINFRFNPSEEVNFRLSYSTGFRAPQAFDEDFHIAIVGGERVVTVLAKNLRQEKSKSISMSADLYHNFGKVQTNLLIEGFYTNLDDVFALRNLDIEDENGNSILERYNASGKIVAGINAEGKIIFPNNIQFQAGITIQKSKYKEAESWSDDPNVSTEKRTFKSPNVYGYSTFTFNPFKNFNCSLSGTYTGEMLVQHMKSSGAENDIAIESSDFFDLNIKLDYDFRVFDYINLEINAGLKNIFNSYQSDFDKGADRDSGYIYGPSQPRSLFAGIKVNF